MNIAHRDGLYLVIIIDISAHLGHPLSRRRWMFFGQALKSIPNSCSISAATRGAVQRSVSQP
jgi:hypothetical protein